MQKVAGPGPAARGFWGRSPLDHSRLVSDWVGGQILHLSRGRVGPVGSEPSLAAPGSTWSQIYFPGSPGMGGGDLTQGPKLPPAPTHLQEPFARSVSLVHTEYSHHPFL